MESADRNAKDSQKTQLPAVNAVRPPVKTHFKAPPQPTGNMSCTRVVECYRCRGPHLAKEYQFGNTECHLCKKKGHLAHICRSKKADTGKPPQQRKKAKRAYSQKTHSVVATETAENDTNASAYTLFNVSSSPSEPYVVTVQINGAELPMEVDTGASLTLNSQEHF